MNERDKTAQMMQDSAGNSWGTEAHFQAFADLIRADEREACAKMAEQYGPNRPIVATQPSERIKGRWEGEQAASSGISAAIRARGNT